MHTDSSAIRTWRLSRSASLNTATVEILSSRQARITRSAISPRLAIRTLRNMPLSGSQARSRSRPRGPGRPGWPSALGQLQIGAGSRLTLHHGVDRLPDAVGGGEDALELQRQRVGMVAVPERVLLGDQTGLQEAQNRLIEALHAVLSHALRHDVLDQRRLGRVEDVLLDGRGRHHHFDRRHAPLAVGARDQALGDDGAKVGGDRKTHFLVLVGRLTGAIMAASLVASPAPVRAGARVRPRAATGTCRAGAGSFRSALVGTSSGTCSTAIARVPGCMDMLGGSLDGTMTP